MIAKMKVNKELLPMKGHFFLFNAGTAPLVPYLSTYARQLGFSSYIVGIIYTVLPISGLIAKPLFGAIADRYRIQKTLFILFQAITALTFLGIYFIPQGTPTVKVQLHCGDGETFLKSCPNSDSYDACDINMLYASNDTVMCEMICDVSSPGMWQTVCEHWHVPQYCYNSVDNIHFTTSIDVSKTVVDSNCANLYTDEVTLDGVTYVPRCFATDGLVNANEPCNVACPELKIGNKVNMSCLKENTHFSVCGNTTEDLANFASLNNNNSTVSCEAECVVDKPWRLMEICEGWKADAAMTCQPKTQNGEEFPNNFEFSGIIPLGKTLLQDDCVFLKLQEIVLADGSIHYPSCPSVSTNTTFISSCYISCNNEQVNQVLEKSIESNSEDTSQLTLQFWLFFILMIASWVGQAVVVSIADAICFDMLGNKPSAYGRQRLWGSVGWGTFSLLTGVLIDEFSGGSATKNYTVAFVLMFIFLSLDTIVSYMIKYKATKMSFNILGDIGALLSSWHTLTFLVWTVAVGLCTGLLWQFLFWHLEDIAKVYGCATGYIKTLQGLVSAIQCFGGEIPFMFLSGPILKRIGHTNMMSVVLLAFGVRFILYSFLWNPWWVLPIELFQGITFGMFYPTMTSYASVVAPPGTEATVQGLVGAVFEGVGTSLGSYVGGVLYGQYGGWLTFRWFGCGALVACVLHVAVECILTRRASNGFGEQQEYSSIIRYATPVDAVQMLEDNEIANPS